MTAIANDITLKMSDKGWFVPSNIFAGSFLHAAAENIEQKSGKGTTYVPGSVIYQTKRNNAPLLTSEAIASDTRSELE